MKYMYHKLLKINTCLPQTYTQLLKSSPEKTPIYLSILNPKVDTPLFAATVAAAAQQLYQVTQSTKLGVYMKTSQKGSPHLPQQSFNGDSKCLFKQSISSTAT